MNEDRCVIFNPTARGEKALSFRQHLSELAGCALMPTTAPGAARTLAAEAVRHGFRTIVAAGGDGTINEVVNGIGDASDGFSRARLGVIPLGTVNVFARELGIPANPRDAWQIIVAGRERSIDLPCITYQAGEGPESRYFVQMAGAGLDALAVRNVSWKLKKRAGGFAYVWSGAQSLMRRQPLIETESPGGSHSGELLIVSNGRLYGGNFAVCPNAQISDGLLDVCVFPKMNWWRLPVCLLAILVKRANELKLTRCFQTAAIKLTSHAPVWVQVDGEPVGRLPAAIGVRPGLLRVVVP